MFQNFKDDMTFENNVSPLPSEHPVPGLARPLHIVINKNSGTVLNKGEDWIRDRIDTILSGKTGDIHMVEGKDITGILESLMARNDGDILIGGGDGTIAACAHLFMNQEVDDKEDRDKIAFGVLPLGTMNLLAGDLGVPSDPEEAMTAYHSLKTMQIDVASVNGHYFLCNAAIGMIPEASIAREEVRKSPSLSSWSSLAAAIVGGLDQSMRRSMRITINNRHKKIRTNVLVVANNAYTMAPTSASERLKRESLRDGLLAVYSARPRALFAAFRLLARLVTGGWQADPAIHRFHVRQMRVTLEDKTTMLALDGEPIEMQSPLSFEIHPRALNLLIPTGPTSLQKDD